MAMRPAVLRHTIIIIVFSVVQWGFMRYILSNQLFNLDTYQRILYFSMSSFIAGFFIISALIYLVLKGNADRE
ncbi:MULTISPECIES: hypothetical protein [Acinetobacter]|uniref:Uncharacterized protein n=1 Tax=Acinetobacter rongchengensis TaxID=2419601 RepID=A0A3A8EX95_9GAMM|nr:MULTISPECIES: hypothetical protein [Acinetobacter]RKG39472.1 hypothetical protein D7V20_04570 [Acinetobacter rongchengensis]